MRLEPLNQWICDTCGEVINSTRDGYVQWDTNENDEIIDFIIVHHKPASPRKDTRAGCYRYSKDKHIKEFLGEKGLVRLHSLLDPGQYHLPTFRGGVSNIRGWSEFYKRLHLSYYEEARQYWGRAMNDGYFGGSNEIFIYLPDNLKGMIEHYEEEDSY